MEQRLMGCAPYLQIFKAGQLVFTTAATLHYQQKEDELPFCQVVDGTVSFQMDVVVQGDILLRCRHLTANGQRVSMFRTAFHTGYVPPNVMRLTKAQLDGACNDPRFSDEFFLDLIFEPCDAEVASKHLRGKADASGATALPGGDARNEAEERRGRGTLAGADADQQHQSESQSSVSPPDQDQTKQSETQPQATASSTADASSTSPSKNPTVTASAYDSMLHRDSRFWDVIAARRQQHASDTTGDTNDPFWGETIGRRRKFDKDMAGKADTEGTDAAASKPLGQDDLFAAFSIGGAELDFAPPTVQEAEQQKEQPKERDELMEALEAIDDDGAMSPVQSAKKVRQQEGVEEVVFDMGGESGAGPSPAFKKPVKESAPVKAVTTEPTVPVGTASVNTPTNMTAPTVTPNLDKTETPTSTKGDDKKKSIEATTTETDEMTELLNQDLNIGGADEDDDVAALLNSVGDDGNDDDDDDANLDDFDFDVDDDELEDLENFLTK